MPREITHWLVLNSALNQLGGKFSTLLNSSPEHRQAALLGAVLHDAPYYHRLGRSDFVKVGNFLHGHADKDTLDPIRNIIAHAGSANREITAAVIIGMLSHMATDISFHPFIFYFTGDYYHPDKSQGKIARARHRAIEVYLDTWAMQKSMAGRDAGRTPRISGFSPVFAEVAKIVTPAVTLDGIDAGPEIWMESFRDMGKLQALFLSPVTGALMKINNFFSGNKLAEWEALYSFGRGHAGDFFKKSHRFQNPVSGERDSAGCDMLLERAVAKTMEYIQAFDDGKLDQLKGESLNYGLFGVSPEGAKFFAPTDEWRG